MSKRTAVQGLRSQFEFSGVINWFPGHMKKATDTMRSKYRHVDVVVEVRDARIPYSSSNRLLLEDVLPGKQRLVLFNKSDLSDPTQFDTIKEHTVSQGHSCLFVSSRQGHGKGLKQIIPTAIAQAKREFKTTPVTLLVVGMPNVGKSSLINDIRAVQSGKRKVASTGPQPGVTRKVTAVKVSDKPAPTYLVDSPGVMVPKVDSAASGLKLALCGAVKDKQVGVQTIADYLLFSLNQHNVFTYVDKLGLSAPSDDIDQVLDCAAHHFRMQSGEAGRDAVAAHIVHLFRNGDFGPVLLDNADGSIDESVLWLRKDKTPRKEATLPTEPER